MHCLIVDDDPLLCDLLEHFCSKTPMISKVTISNNGFEAINLLNQNRFELILLDYDLPDITAKEILPLIDMSSQVIMITANKDFGHESYNYEQIIDFLVKPVEYPRFLKAILKAGGSRPSGMATSQQLFIKDGNELVSVKLSNVLFIKSAGNYAELILNSKKIMTLMTLKELETKLTDNFQRVHRSCIVNIEKIDRITNTDVIIGTHEIAVSNSHREGFMQKISYLK